jgi:hypothetical protein
MAVLLNVHPAAVGVMRYQHEKATHDVMLYRHDRYRPSDYQVLTTTGLCDVSTTLSDGERCRKLNTKMSKTGGI